MALKEDWIFVSHTANPLWEFEHCKTAWFERRFNFGSHTADPL